MSNLTITIDEDLKKKMRELKQVNWSKVAREAFEQKIRQEKRKQTASEIRSIREKDQTKWSGSGQIRKWRDMQK